MWYKESVFYQIYSFGFCGAPDENDNTTCNRIKKVSEWIPHFKKLGINTIYFCPVFESDAHGYDTRDYTKIDCRLGSNEDFSFVCNELHGNEIRIVIDGVFNHVGRGFWAFQDVLKNRQASPYKDWFFIDFGRDNSYKDGLWYEGWEGYYNLVKLNLHNQQVVEHLFESIKKWVKEFDIDGLRLDVAYLLNEDFLRKLRSFTKSLKADFFLVGEAIHGDYNRIVNGEMLDSCTNYECFKGIFSSFNDRNMFEIAYSLNRQFGSEHWTLYKGLDLFNFVDNHDVTRIKSNLKDPRNLQAAFGILFAMPGIPCVYYGSEWGVVGEKTSGSDKQLRPCFPNPIENEITEWISFLTKIRKENLAFIYGDYKQLYLTNMQFVFMREYKENKIIAAVNSDGTPHFVSMPFNHGVLVDLRNNNRISCNERLELAPFSIALYKLE